MKARKIIGGGWIAIVIAFIGCAVNPGVTPVPPVVVDQSGCEAACASLNRLDCEDGKDIDMKLDCTNNSECSPGQTCSPVTKTCIAPCVTFCRDTVDNGVWLAPNCVALITSCDQIENCPLAEKKTAQACDSLSCPINL